MIKQYFISVDGGGTKTKGVLYSKDKHIIKEATSGYTNFYVNEKVAKKHLLEVLDELTHTLDKPYKLMIILGISGSTGIDKTVLTSELDKRYDAKSYLYSDDVLAIHSIKKNEDKEVILMIGGTGSSVTYTIDGKVAQIGGFGHLLGDEGSAYHLSIQTLKYVIRQIEAQESLSMLSQKVLAFIEGKTTEDIKQFVYQNEKTTIANVAQVVDQLARLNDPLALAFIDQEIKDAARQIVYAYRHMNDPKHVTIALRGGFLTKAFGVKQKIETILKKDIKIFTLDNEAVIPNEGGYYMGLQLLREGDC